MPNKSLKHRHFVAGQFLSRAFVVLLRKSIPQNHNLKTAAELGVRCKAMIAVQIYLLNGWTVEFEKNIHMYSHSLKLSRGREAYQVFCEDSPSGFVGIWRMS